MDYPILLSADDAKIYQSVRCEADYLQLQCYITTLYRWSKIWLLNFNISKCHLLHLGPTHCYIEYYINRSVITPTESVKDLGIIVDSSIKFHTHTGIVAARANRMLALINKSFEYLSTNMLLQLYKLFVRPILEYGILYGDICLYFTNSQLKRFKGELLSFLRKIKTCCMLTDYTFLTYHSSNIDVLEVT